MKIRVKPGTVLIVTSLIVIFVFFQNFQSYTSQQVCRAYLSQSNSDPAVIDLGKARKKSECLKMTIAELEHRQCSDGSARVQVVLKDEVIPGREVQVPSNNLVADFNCRSLISQTVGAEGSESGAQTINREKFEAISQRSDVSSEVLTLESFSMSCPGCYNTIQRRIAEDDFDVCHELAMVERVAENENGEGLSLSRGQSVEYQCRRKIASDNH